MKPFTTIAGFLFLLGAAIHAYRLYAGFAINVAEAEYAIPRVMSWASAAIGVILDMILLREARR